MEKQKSRLGGLARIVRPRLDSQLIIAQLMSGTTEERCAVRSISCRLSYGLGFGPLVWRRPSKRPILRPLVVWCRRSTPHSTHIAGTQSGPPRSRGPKGVGYPFSSATAPERGSLDRFGLQVRSKSSTGTFSACLCCGNASPPRRSLKSFFVIVSFRMKRARCIDGGDHGRKSRSLGSAQPARQSGCSVPDRFVAQIIARAVIA